MLTRMSIAEIRHAHRTIKELREHEIESAKLCTPEQSLQAQKLLVQIEQEVEIEYGALQLLASPADHKLPGMMYDVTFPQLFRMQYTVRLLHQQLSRCWVWNNSCLIHISRTHYLPLRHSCDHHAMYRICNIFKGSMALLITDALKAQTGWIRLEICLM